jgi:hypothetical protein
MRTRSHAATLKLLNQFSKELGWGKLTRYSYNDDPNLKGTSVFYEAHKYDSVRWDCFLHINEWPHNQDKHFEVSVYATKYKICSGWRLFRVTNLEQAIREAKRLADSLSYRNFESLKARNVYRKLHPECTGYTRVKVRMVGPPITDPSRHREFKRKK